MQHKRIPPATPEEAAGRELVGKADPIAYLEGDTDFLHTKNSGHFADKAFELKFAPVIKSVSYLNLTQMPIWVTDHDNLPFCVTPSRVAERQLTLGQGATELVDEVSSQGDEFIIIQTHRYSRDAVRQIREMYKKTKNPSRLLSYLYEKSKTGQSDLYGIVYSRLLRFKASEIRAHNKGFYCQTADVWMTTDPHNTTHPVASRNKRDMMDQVLDTHALAHKLGVVVDFVVNTPVRTQRFFNFLGNVYEITSRPDPLRDNGIYLYQSKNAVGTVTALDVVEEFTPLEELNEHQHFYTTASDAKTLGNSDGIVKVLEAQVRMKRTTLEEMKTIQEAKNLEASAELENIKNANRILTEENTRIAVERDREIAALKHTHALEIAQLNISVKREEVQLDERKTTQELHRENIKDFYDTKQMTRKDVNEGTKFAYGIATAVFGFFVAVGTWLVSRMGKTKAIAGLAGLLL